MSTQNTNHLALLGCGALTIPQRSSRGSRRLCVALAKPSLSPCGLCSILTTSICAFWLALSIAGCNSEPILSESILAEPNPALVDVFVDDADPAVAALDFVRDELLVQPFPGADQTALAALYRSVGASVIDASGEIDLTVLSIENGQYEKVASQIAQSRLVESIHKNYVFEPQMLPNDPFLSDQNYLAVAGVIDAWSLSTGSVDVITAMVDTGVDLTHPDLVDKIIGGWNVFDDSADFGDQAGHGTRVAGVLAAAGNNGRGVAGVALENPLLVVRATNAEGQATSRHIAAGILWAVSHGAKVVNVSFAPLWSNRVVQAAARQAFNQGAIVIISAGNGGGSSKAPGYQQSLFVGALSDKTQLASFSDKGPFLDLVAPGTDIRTTSLGGQYAFADGTSFAAPIVSGIAALTWSVNPDLRPATISRLLTANSVDLGAAGDDDSFGQGAINAADAVAQASRTTFLPDVLPPAVQITSPGNGAILRGREFVTVNATDRWGVADVVMSIDGVVQATDTLPPYRFLVDTNEFEAGNHDVDFVATDLAGHRSAPTRIILNLVPETANSSNSATPSVSVSDPVNGSQVNGNVSVRAFAKSAIGLSFVEWFLDGELVAVDTLSGQSSGINFLWRSDSASAGAHVITAVVTDNAGTSASGSVSLLVS